MKLRLTRGGGAEPSDAELVRQFQSGREQAFVELMSRHERRVYNLAFRMLGRTEDARDATQEAFLSCFRNISSFRGDAAFTTWLHRIAVNACYDLLRRRPPVSGSLEDRPEAASTPDHADQAAASADVQRALMAVPPEFRSVLVLHEIQDVAVDEIAATLDIPVGTVKSRLHRGRVALARALGEDSRSPGPSEAMARHPGSGAGSQLVSPLEPRGAPAPSNPPIQ